jgi:hypothetical protein
VRKTFLMMTIVLSMTMRLPGGDLLGFGVGTITLFQKDPFSPGTVYATWVDIRNYITGSEARLNLFGLEIDGYVFQAQGDIIEITEQGRPVYRDDISQRYFGMVAVGASTEVASFTRLGLGLGTSLGVDVGLDRTLLFWAGDKGNIYTAETQIEFLQNIQLEYRMKMDLFLGHFILGINYQVPSIGASFLLLTKDALQPDWERGRLAFTFISRFF